ncbi:MarR family transcriptional regulator [Subtercola boreus]|uniref:MarR family transcriptional regulator n=1 Tax=Subtercola boreus TaxID=120213 RepID=A0A3E0VWT8_9MICO|nr:MarR family transcriptional regulator [Subtercola boreus]RFA14065.1 MarR family transcriptional regulator [Subtercola boreus]
MPDESQPQHDSVGAWAKQYYFASRALIEATLREHGIGPTQWYVLHQLVNEGPTTQRELALALKIERATMSGVVSTLVRKGLVAQIPDAADQRQRILSVTAAGRTLWAGLPDPVALATAASFEGVDEADLAVARRVLQAATARLLEHLDS